MPLPLLLGRLEAADSSLMSPTHVGSNREGTLMTQAVQKTDGTTTIKGADLPGLVRLEGNGVMIKVIIKNWRV